MIKNVVFDMGNVLIYFRPVEFIERLGLGTEDSELLNNVVFRSVEWTYLDDGTMTEPEVVEALKSKLPERLHDSMRRLVLEWDQPLLLVEGMTELIASLKEKGLKIYLLSNTSSRQREYWPRVEASRYFDGTFLSADAKEVKPGEKIFRMFFEKFDLKPEECIFVDDHEPNIITARALGMNGIIFKNAAELADELKSYL